MADWDTTSPADNDFISQYPANERAARAALVTNFGTDHYTTNDADVGKHKVVQLLVQSDPSAVAGQGALYAKTVSSQAELMWRSSTGSAIQLTVQGGLNAAVVTGNNALPDAVLSTNVPLKNAANTFTAAQTVTVADDTTGIRTNAANGRIDLAGYLTATSGGNIDFLNLAGSAFVNGRIRADTLALSGATAITLNSVNVTDYARKSQSNTFTNALQTISGTSARLEATDGAVTARIMGEASSSAVEVGAVTAHALKLLSSGTSRLEISSGGDFDFKSGTVTTSNASAQEVGYKGVPINSQSDNYTLVLTDAGKCVRQTGSGKTVTIPAHGAVAFPDGTMVTFEANETMSIAITTNTLYLAGTNYATTGTRTLARGGIASAMKRDSGSWIIWGTGLS